MIDKRVVVVTGGAGHLGMEFCRLFAEEGFAVVVADLDRDQAQKVATGLSAIGHEAIGVEVDVTSETSVEQMASEVGERFGRADVLINNAGLFGNPVWTGSLLDVEMSQWDAVINVNLKGPVLCTRALAPLLQNADYGRIVNISTQGAYTPHGVYSASKLALHQVTWQLARELGPHITVNAVGPGTMDVPTVFSNRERELVEQAIQSNFIVKRLGRPEDLYAAIRYFVSREAAWCTGQVLLVNGGANVRL